MMTYFVRIGLQL